MGFVKLCNSGYSLHSASTKSLCSESVTVFSFILPIGFFHVWRMNEHEKNTDL